MARCDGSPITPARVRKRLSRDGNRPAHEAQGPESRTERDCVRLRNHASAGSEVVRAFAAGVDRELRAKHAAGQPYSTLNARGEVVFVHPDGTVRTGRAGDSPAVP